jgi:hypothetical protein
MKHPIFVLIALTILLGAPASASAQATAQLSGRVTDESGASGVHAVAAVNALQLGQSGDELQCGHLRPNPVADGRSTNHAVRRQIWFLSGEGIR